MKMKTKGYKAGGKMPMAKDPKTGKMVPEFAADGVGDMKAGGKVKQMNMGGLLEEAMPMKKKKKQSGAKMMTKGYKKGGKVRGAGIARKGVRPAKIV
jgi:hypothetical protein